LKKHTKIYLNYFGYDTTDFIPCEICGNQAVDINHIEARGMGGNPKGDKDEIENLMAVCRSCHEEYGDKKQHKHMLKVVHKVKMNERNYKVRTK
jgi:predicted restriction endonuclease